MLVKVPALFLDTEFSDSMEVISDCNSLRIVYEVSYHLIFLVTKVSKR